MDALPDPMKLDLPALVFVILLVTALFIFLKYAFFKPMVKVMDEREEAIRSGAAKRAEVAALVERRQEDYAARLRDLRAQAFERRKALSAAALQEKQALLDQARAESAGNREAALAGLQEAQARARTDLMAQVEVLSESMAEHLLRQA